MAGRNNAVLKPQKNAHHFNIYHRDEKGTPDYQYPPSHPITTCVVKFVNICREMLAEVPVRKAFGKIARDFCKANPKAWFLKDRPNTQETWGYIVDTFVEKILTAFPTIFVDYSLKNPDLMGTHIRGLWNDDFKASDQFILFNGPSISHLLGAEVSAKTEQDPTGPEHRDSQAFKFMFANVTLHEIAHVFITYLGEGRVSTPPSLTPGVANCVPEINAEAGCTLEYYLHGGRLNHPRDPFSGTPTDYCGTAYVEDKGHWYRITEEAIEMTVKDIDEHDFKFPYPRSSIAESRSMITIGEGRPIEVVEDPADYPEWPALRDAPPPPDPPLR